MNNLMDLMKGLSNEVRLRILVLLYKNELCVCEIQDITQKPQPQISKQLRILRDLNLIAGKKRDKFVFFSLVNDELVENFITTIKENIHLYPDLKFDIEKSKLSNVYQEKNC